MSSHNQITEIPVRTCDLRDAAANFTEMHRRVIESGRRVEVVPDDGSASSVLISKAELECLERAVEILGDSDAVKALCGEIAMLASRAGGAPAQA